MAGGNFQWIPDVPSGVSRNHALSSDLRFASIARTKFVQFCRAEPGFGAHRGDTVTIQRVRNIAEPTTAVLSATGKIPVDTLAMSTKAITVSEFGRAVGYNRKVELLATFDPENAIQKSLLKQMKLTIDTVAATQFKAAQIRYGPTSQTGGTFTTDGGSTAQTATNNLTVQHVKIIRDYMQETIHVEPYEGDYYMALAAVKATRGVKDDPEFHSWRQYLQPGDAFFHGEVGMIENIRFIEVNHTNALSSTKGTGSVLGETVFFGADPVALAEVEAPELLAGIPGDFGRQRAVAWFGVLAFGIVWDTEKYLDVSPSSTLQSDTKEYALAA